MNRMRILLLGATFGTDNLGVGALTAGALSVLTRRYPDAEIHLLDYARRPTTSCIDVGGQEISVPLINLRFSWKIFLPNNVAFLLLLSGIANLFGPRLRKWLIERNRRLKAISQADVAVALSGGDSFSDIYGLGRFFYVFLPQLLVVLLGKRLILLPQTIGPFKGRLAKWLAPMLMRRAERIYSREDGSIEEIRRMLSIDGDKVRFAYDLGFVVEPHRPPAPEPDIEERTPTRPLIGLNVSGLLLIGGYDKRNMFGLKVDYQVLVRRIIEMSIDRLHADVILIPHVLGDHPESDIMAVEAIYRDMAGRYAEHLSVLRGRYDQNEVKYVIGRCDFFIGSRMHACIAALSQAIPAIGIAYSQKFSGVLKSIGVGHLVADPRHLSADEILDVVGKAFHGRRAIKAGLEATMPGVRERVFAISEELV